jgi:hypothetical protein
MEVSGYMYALVPCTQTRYPLDKRICGPRASLKAVEKRKRNARAGNSLMIGRIVVITKYYSKKEFKF